MLTVNQLEEHLAHLKACALCPNMIGPVVTPNPVPSKVYLVGQAPGTREGEFGKPFAWTAGKTMFRWFASIGINEEDFRNRAYMSAVCRCFPGKAKTGGDRVPSPQEIEACSTWMKRELDMLSPELVIPVGRLAIEQFLPPMPLTDCVGKQLRAEKWSHEFDLIPLPHPSGASTWFKKDPGKTLLTDALSLIQQHRAWRALLADSADSGSAASGTADGPSAPKGKIC